MDKASLLTYFDKIMDYHIVLVQVSCQAPYQF